VKKKLAPSTNTVVGNPGRMTPSAAKPTHKTPRVASSHLCNRVFAGLVVSLFIFGADFI